ncbi:MAG: GNAT family N-acetyltransferase [Anaerofustis sp.]
MKIQTAQDSDIPHILMIYNQAKLFMRETGNSDQWVGTYPEESLLREDIINKNLYICIDKEDIAASFFFRIGDDPTYATIVNGDWLNDDPYGVIHRLAVARHERGIATYCIDWALSRCGNLRIDTHEENRPMRNLLDKLGFTECGTIYLPDGAPRIAYQKTEQ